MMLMPLSLCLLSIELLLLLKLIHCAPKIGGIMFEPILFEAFKSDEKTTISKQIGHKLPRSVVNKELFTVTERSKHSVSQVETQISKVDMESPEEETVVTSSSATTAEETTAFISEINIEIESIAMNTSLAFNHTSADQHTTTAAALTTKKVMLYELFTADKQKQYGRARDESTTEKMTLNFMGYNFDDTICQIVDDRVLCGYNSNPQLASPVQTVEVGNGCRLRGDRIECGYVNPPFDGMRRPAVRPGGNRNFQENFSDKKFTISSEESLEWTSSYSTAAPTTSTTELTTITTAKVTSKVTSTTEATTNIITTSKATANSPSTITVTLGTIERTTAKIREHCVEKENRIVCYDVKK